MRRSTRCNSSSTASALFALIFTACRDAFAAGADAAAVTILEPALTMTTVLVVALAAVTAWLFVSRKRIRASEEQFRHLFEGSLQAQMLLRGDQLVAMNRAALDMLGIDDPGYVVGRTPLDFSPEVQPCGTPTPEKARQMIELAFRDGNHQFLWRHRRMDGREFDAQATLLIVKVRGEQLVFCVTRDISAEQRAKAELDTYRRHLEALVSERTSQLLEAKSLAEAASAAKGAFLANMSHEIRTPLNAVLGYSQLLQDEISDPVQQRKLREIERAGDHLLGILNNVLDLAKVESGRLILEEVPIDLDALLRDVQSMLAESAVARRDVLRTEISRELRGVTLLGDRHRLRQVLINLASNGIKFTEGGEVVIRASRVTCDDEHVEIRVEVADNGIGISRVDQTRLFVPFEQAESSTTRAYGGTGLGLAISKEFVDLMGGECGVTSAPGQGSTFWFKVRLRRASARKKDAIGHATEAAPRPGSHVLLVEDNEVNRMVAVALLQRLGLVVEVATDGAESIPAFQRGRHDLILMDVHMPIMDGLEATRRIRSLTEGKDVPIIAMTASAFSHDRQQCLDAGMNEHIAKPIVAAVLKQTLADWLPQREVA